MKLRLSLLVPVLLFTVCGCTGSGQDAEQEAASAQPGIVVCSITSSATEDPHSVTMALQLAGHVLDDSREAVLFFNVRGVQVPVQGLPEDLAFHAEPIRSLLTNLIGRGAQAHVCPHCMQALGVQEQDLLPGAVVTNREALFSKLGPNTVVFTY